MSDLFHFAFNLNMYKPSVRLKKFLSHVIICKLFWIFRMLTRRGSLHWLLCRYLPGNRSLFSSRTNSAGTVRSHVVRYLSGVPAIISFLFCLQAGLNNHVHQNFSSSYTFWMHKANISTLSFPIFSPFYCTDFIISIYISKCTFIFILYYFTFPLFLHLKDLPTYVAYGVVFQLTNLISFKV